MKINSLFWGTLIVGLFSIFAVGCKSSVDSVGNSAQTVTNMAAISNSNSVNNVLTSEEALSSRAGIGCVNDQDHAVIDPDLRVGDSVSKEIKYGRVNDVITKDMSISFLNSDNGKMHLQEKVISIVSLAKGDLLEAPIESAVTCDPQLPLNIACKDSSQVVQKGQKSNICRIVNVEKIEMSDASGNFTMKSGLVVAALKRTRKVIGQVTCGQARFGHGAITEELISTRDIVAVSDLVACGGVPIMHTRTAVIDAEHKVIQSQTSEILSAPKRQ